MRRLFAILPLLLAIAVSCGPSTNLSSDEDESINLGYGKVRKSGLTFSVSKVNVTDRSTDTYTNMYDYLRGRVAGVSIGPDNSITIRGKNSINSSTEPLFILDGTPINNLDSINPKDVESVEVLKDGSASIYGVRGANGVIIITTRH